MTRLSRKQAGAYYTPDAVVANLVRWVVRRDRDRLLDPSCGDGRFIAAHRNSFGVEQDAEAAAVAMGRAPGASVHPGDFFDWAARTRERFECAAGNPPFIRYQTFKGEVRERALQLCARLGAKFSGLTGSWAPFLVATASLLKPGGRMAFVVPAAIGHAPYAAPLLDYLVGHFDDVRIVAVRTKLFPDLSEDCRRLRRQGRGAPLQCARSVQSAGGAALRGGYDSGPRMAHVVEPPSSPVPVARERPRALSGDRLESGLVAFRRPCLHRNRIRQRRQRILPPAAFRSRSMGDPGRTPPSDGAKRPDAAGPDPDGADYRAVAWPGSAPKCLWRKPGRCDSKARTWISGGAPIT